VSDEKQYVLGTDRDELERLGLQHRAWRAQAYEHWERAGFGPGSRVLDVGCGPGWATLDLAPIVGDEGSVTAIDVSRRFLDHIEAQVRRAGITNVRTRESDLLALDLEPGSATGAWCRWVLSFVRDPDAAIGRVARVLRPGATWALQEYVSYSSMRLGPRGAALPRVVRAIEESWRAQGGEPDVGLRLPTLLEKHGLSVIETRPISRIARPGSLLWEWPGSFFSVFVPKLVTAGHLTKAEADAFLEEWRSASKDPGSVFFAPSVVAVTAVKR